MTDDNAGWIAGDGGPLVVLQNGALPQWRGAADFDQSLMNGGPLETDYDVVCDCNDHHLHRHGRDMLVLDDSEWSGRLLALPNGMVLVEQPYYTSEAFPDVVQQIATAQPERQFAFEMVDDRLRLLVGADSADGKNYGFSEIAIAPGPKQCEVFRFDNVLAIKISPAG